MALRPKRPKPRPKSRNKVTIKRRLYTWGCQLCGEVIEHSTKLGSTAAATDHMAKYHTTQESDYAALDALDDMVGGVPQYRAILRRQRARIREIMELERMHRLRDRRPKPPASTPRGA